MSIARPELLLLALAPLLLRFRRRANTLHALGDPATLESLTVHRPQSIFISSIFLVLAWLMLTVAVAGPRHGLAPEAGVAIGREIVLVLDFSKSTWAADMNSSSTPERWQAELAAARQFVSDCKTRGGDRIAIVVFAAKPVVIAPLTTDYDHLLFRLESLDARHPPAEIAAEDDSPSGTRIGAALRQAAELHDPRFPGAQEIVLLTDADDPAGDNEWTTGALKARELAVPVHVIGLGDPDRDAMLLQNGVPLETSNKTPILTRLQERLARAIASDTGGEYLPSHTRVPDLAAWDRGTLATRELQESRAPQPREISVYFYAMALSTLATALLCRSRGV